VLFDLNSTGGTYVNGQRIYQHALKAGDVISLSGVPVIYGEDTPSDEVSPEADLEDEPNSHTAPMG
jgi:pSer/pThr/pTyr-binding forkhead associated (FHA) protein